MAVAAAYLTKIRRAVRRNTSTDTDAELTDIIEECRLDMQRLGITKTTDETDFLILGAVRSFARWKFGLNNEDAEANREDYFKQVDELRRLRDYVYYTITFDVTSSEVAVEDAEITFNSETQSTDTNGQAIFYYVSKGVNQKYTVTHEGTTVEDDIDVTANATVSVVV